MTVLSAAVLLFLVLDPLGNILFFLSALKHVPASRQQFVIVRELLFALVALLLFLFLGGSAMKLLGLSEQSLSIGGGVILMLIALRMVFPSPEHREEDVDSEPFIVPLAIPYVAGPSALATVLLLMSRQPARWPEWVLAILLAWGACVPIMLASGFLRRLLGHRGLTAIERLMGLVLVTIAVEMLMTGVAEFLAKHH